jgi:hypothetical protein
MEVIADCSCLLRAIVLKRECSSFCLELEDAGLSGASCDVHC